MMKWRAKAPVAPVERAHEEGRKALLRVISVVRADLDELRARGAAGPALVRAGEHAELIASGGQHLYRTTEAMAEAGRRIAPTGRPPCLFNPVHGPATGEVVWSPGNSVPRRVPVCDADAVRVTNGQQPDVRRVPTDFGPQPYFAGGDIYGDWILGWYAGEDPAGLLAGTDLGARLRSHS